GEGHRRRSSRSSHHLGQCGTVDTDSVCASAGRSSARLGRSTMRIRTAVLAAGAALIGVATAVLPANAALAAGTPDIAITGSFDKATYTIGETFTLTVKVTNKGTVDATNVHITGGDSEGVENTNFGAIQTGFDLAAGATRTVDV